MNIIFFHFLGYIKISMHFMTKYRQREANSHNFGVFFYSEYIMHIFTVNFALNKPAYMQYQYKPGDNRYDASNAVDGQKSNLSLNGGQCSSSVASKQNATWWVNLTRIQNIHHIRIYTLKSNYAWGMVIFNCCPLITYSKLYSLVSFRSIILFRSCMTFIGTQHFCQRVTLH